MKIKSQLLATIVSFAIVLVIISTSIFYTNLTVTELSNQQDIAGNIQTTVGQLNHIASQYFLFQNDSELVNWQNSVININGNLSQLTMNNPQQESIMGTLSTDTQNVDSAFNSTVSYLQIAPRNQSVRVLPEFQSVWSDLTDKTQALSNDSAQLSQILRNQTDQAHLSNIILILALLATFAVFFFINYLINYRKTLDSISTLQEGINIIGSGNLDFSVKADKKDEIGELSGSVNLMAKNLKDLNNKLQDQERMVAIGQTAGMVGHDLRNPLQAIIGEVYLAKDELQALPESEQKTNLHTSLIAIEEEISYMDKIVSDLQTFVRPVQVKKIIFNIKHFVVERLAEISIPSNVTVLEQIQEDLVIEADPQLMKRVLINLINNAVQAMPEGGKLGIYAKVEASKVKISVEDTGIGIPDEIKSKLFTPLFTTKPKGQGFGLAVCKRVIEAQGGTITFESKKGKGTKFEIELPTGN
jgi:signal transduction histidine kinase